MVDSLLLVVHGVQSGISFTLIRKPDEAKTTAAVGITVFDNNL